MAFMMPVMKQNYALYGKQQRKNASDSTDSGDGGGKNGARRKVSQAQNVTGHARRRVKSEGPSLSTSPQQAPSQVQKTKPIGMRRGRGSAPVLSALAPMPSVSTSISLNPNSSTAPSASPAPITIGSSPSRSSSSSSSGSTSNLGRFHTKLITRLRRSLRLTTSLKEPEPTPS